MNEPRRAATARIQSLPRQPPHSVEAEQSILGGLLLRNETWHEIADKITERDFYRADHQLLFRAIGEMIGAGKVCDFVTLSEHLTAQERLDEAGGRAYVASLAVDTYSIANVLAYAEIVRERSVLRGLIAAGTDIGDLGYRSEGRKPAELVDAAEQMLLALRDRRATSAALSPEALADKVFARIDALRADPKALVGLSTGFAALDGYTQGLHDGDLTIIAARPSMGKTTLATNIADNVALHGIPSAVFSMEMSAEQITQRRISSLARVDLTAIRTGRVSDADADRLASARGLVRSLPVYIDEAGALSPLELRSRARRLVAKHGVRLVVVDYIQLMRVDGAENRTNEVSEISRQLKALAKDLGVSVIALSQLNRGVEARDNKRPRLADLRESGGIEQDADVVLFVYRDEVYYPDKIESKGRAEIIIGKQRNGPTGDFELAWMGRFSKFDNLAEPHVAPRPHSEPREQGVPF